MYLLYSVLTVTFFVVMSPYLLWQAFRYRKYIGSLRQRFGHLPITFNLDGEESIWIHAVSVGEVLTARALLPQLRERYPRLRLYLSTTVQDEVCRMGRGSLGEVLPSSFRTVLVAAASAADRPKVITWAGPGGIHHRFAV